MIKKLILMLLLFPVLCAAQTITPNWSVFGAGSHSLSVGFTGQTGGRKTLIDSVNLYLRFLQKMDSVLNDGYVTHGYFNSHLPTGSTFILNQTTLQPNSNYNISGLGKAAGLQTPGLTVTGRFIFNGTGNASAGVGEGYTHSLDLGPTANNDILTQVHLKGTFSTGNAVATVNTIVGGGGYVDGTYPNVQLSNTSVLNGVSPIATIIVSGGQVTTVTPTNGGARNAVGNNLVLFNPLALGGSGSGFSCKVNTLSQYTGSTTYQLQVDNSPALFAPSTSSYGSVVIPAGVAYTGTKEGTISNYSGDLYAHIGGVETKITNQTGSIFSSGLTKIGDTVKLGGTLTEDSYIVSPTHQITIGDTVANSAGLNIDPIDNAFAIYENESSGSIQSSVTGTDGNIHLKGQGISGISRVNIQQNSGVHIEWQNQSSGNIQSLDIGSGSAGLETNLLVDQINHRGLDGDEDFSPHLLPLSYTQKAYVDNRTDSLRNVDSGLYIHNQVLALEPDNFWINAGLFNTTAFVGNPATYGAGTSRAVQLFPNQIKVGTTTSYAFYEQNELQFNNGSNQFTIDMQSGLTHIGGVNPTQVDSIFRVAKTPVDSLDVLRLKDIGGVVPSSGFARKDSSSQIHDNLFRLTDKAVSRLNLGVNLQNVTNIGNSTTNALVTTNHAVQGDSTKMGYVIGEGTSLTNPFFNLPNTPITAGGVTVDTDIFLYKIARAQGYIYSNYAKGGRSAQRLTVGDSSLYDQIGRIPNPPTPNSILLIDCFVNDALKATYDTASYHTMYKAYLVQAKSQGWNRIISHNPSYWNTTALGQSDPVTRHAMYNTATTAIAIETGTLFYDGWAAMRSGAATYVYSDSLHMTAAGHTFAATGIGAFIASNFGIGGGYANIKNTTVGNQFVSGNQFIGGDNTVTGYSYLNDLNVRGLTTLQNATSLTTFRSLNPSSGTSSIMLGGNTNPGDLTIYPNTTKIGGLIGPTYAATPSPYFNALSLNILSYSNTLADNSIDYGRGSSVNYGATLHNWYTSPTSTSLSGVLAMRMYPSGNLGLGNPISDPGSKLKIGGTNTAGTLGSSISVNANMTPTANNQVLINNDFSGGFLTGNGAAGASITTSATSTADGVYDNLSATNITGTGSGQTWKVTIVSGVVTAIVPATSATGGLGYANGNTFSVNTIIGPTFTVSSLGYTGDVLVQSRFGAGINSFVSTTVVNPPGNGGLWFDGTDFKVRISSVTTNLSRPTIVGTLTGGVIPTSLFTGTLAAAQEPAHTGDVTNTAGSLATSLKATGTAGTYVKTTFDAQGRETSGVTTIATADIAANAVTYAKMQAVTTNKLLGSGSGTAVAEITLGTGLSFSGTTLNTNPASLIIGTPTVVAGTGAGTSPTVSVTSNGRGLQLTVTTGTLPTGTNATIATITLANALSYTPYPVFSSASGLTSLLNGASMIFMTSTGTANVTITSGTTALTAATTYVWNIAL